jgi:sarcosine oxidase, subunit gamma
MLERTRGVMDEAAAVRIDTMSGRAALRLRSWTPEHTGSARAVTLDGSELPSQVGATSSRQMRVLCLGPADWLIVGEGLNAAHIYERVAAEVRRQELVLVDQSQGLAILRVQGRAARELLSKGCGLDLHVRSFPFGRCARTRFAQIPVVIDCVGESDLFELYFARSYLAHLRSWLLDAAVEFEVSVA